MRGRGGVRSGSAGGGAELFATTPLKDTEAATRPDVVDDHYYKSPTEMFDLVHHYDNAPRNGAKIFIGSG